MLNVSQRFKELMKAPVKVVRARIEVEDGTVISAEDNLVSITLESQGQYFLSAARTGKATLLGTSWSSLQGKRLTIYLTAYANAEEQEGEEACYGVYTVRLVEANLEKDMTNIEFDGSITRATNTLYKTSVMVFPMTVAELATAVATQGGLTLITDMTTLPNHDYVITEDLWRNINNATFRDVIDQIAGATATIARVGGADNNLEFVPVNQEPVDNLGYENLKKFQLGDEYGKVSSVVLARTPQEDNIFVEDEGIEALPKGKNLVDYLNVGYGNNGASTTKNADSITITKAQDGQYRYNVLKLTQEQTKMVLGKTVSLSYQKTSTISGVTSGIRVFWGSDSSSTVGTQIVNMLSNADGLARGTFQIPSTPPDSSKPLVYLLGYPDTTNSAVADSSVLTISDIQLEIGQPTNYEPFVANGIVEVKLANNEILDDNREAMAQPILDASKGLGYRATELSTEGHGWYEIGDKIDLYENEAPQLPPEYQEVEYLESSGTQYINSNETFDKISKVEIEFKPVEDISGTTVRGVFGMYNLDYGVQAFMRSNGLGTRFASSAVEQSSNFNVSGWNNIVVGKDGIFYNGVKKANSTGQDTSSESTNKMDIFRRTGGEFSSVQIRLFKLWKSDALVRDFVPCYRKSDNVAGLYDKVNGIFYTNAGSGTFTVGENINYDQYIGTTAITYQKLEIAGSFRETLKCTLPEETDTDYATAGSIYGSIWNTEIKVDKQGNEITSIVSRQDQFENETRENFTQVVQNIDSVVTTIQTTGGGNAIHNSVGYNKETDGTLVGWTSTGTVVSETSPESLANGALSGNQIDLGVSSSITQRIAVDSSGSVYTLSFRAKKSVVGQAVVHLRNSLDDYTVVLPNGTGYLWEQFEIVGVKPSESYFDLVVETNNATDYFAITDLMLTVGDSVTPWVQATDEILSRNVALDSNGVKVSSNTSNDYVKLDELGLNGYSDAEGTMENVFTINRDMTEVSKLRARKQIEMPPLKVIPVNTSGNSGWAFVKIGEQ